MEKATPPFLQIWARQLLKEHDSICRRYGLELARPIVEVVAVAGYWGKWLPATRTITFAAALLNNHPWEAVLNVLKHEMAHQMVAEILDGESGHGPDFKRACAILGLPAAYRKARTTIGGRPASIPDPEIAARSRTIAKIRKLLALSDSGNEHESLLAMQKARQLLDRHKLTGEIGGDEKAPFCANQTISLKKKRVESYHRAICSLLLAYFKVEIVITPLYDAQDLTTYKAIDIMGRSENVEIAGYVFHFLMGRLPALWRAHLAINPGRKDGRNSYWLGILNGFREGLAHDRRTDPAAEAGGLPPAPRNLLPIAIDDPTVGAFVTSRYPQLKSSRNRATRVNRHRFEAGRQEGRLLKFRKGLNRDGEPQRLLPSGDLPAKDLP